MSKILTAAELNERNMAIAAAERKAAKDPAALTDEDLAVLPGNLAAELMANGDLVHLGIGRRAGRRR